MVVPQVPAGRPLSVFRDLVTCSLAEARDRMRELQCAAYGLESATVVDGGGYEFVYVRASDGAESRTLLIPADLRDEPSYAVARCGGASLWTRIVSDEPYETFGLAADCMCGMDRSEFYEVIPHIDVFGR